LYLKLVTDKPSANCREFLLRVGSINKIGTDVLFGEKMDERMFLKAQSMSIAYQ